MPKKPNIKSQEAPVLRRSTRLSAARAIEAINTTVKNIEKVEQVHSPSRKKKRTSFLEEPFKNEPKEKTEEDGTSLADIEFNNASSDEDIYEPSAHDSSGIEYTESGNETDGKDEPMKSNKKATTSTSKKQARTSKIFDENFDVIKKRPGLRKLATASNLFTSTPTNFRMTLDHFEERLNDIPTTSFYNEEKTSLPSTNEIQIRSSISPFQDSGICIPSTSYADRASNVSKANHMLSSDDGESDDEWHEMEPIHDVITRENAIQIDIAGPSNAEETEGKYEKLLRQENARRHRERIEFLHQVYLLGHIAHLRYWIRFINDNLVKFMPVSVNEFLPENLQYITPITPKQMASLTKWIYTTFTQSEISAHAFEDTPLEQAIAQAQTKEHAEVIRFSQMFSSRTYHSDRDLAIITFSLLRAMKLTVRLIVSLNPIPESNNSLKPTTKKRKNTDEPKRPKNGFFHFGFMNWEKIMRDNPDLGTGFGPLAKEMGRIWRQMTPIEKEPYQIMNEKDKKRYEIEMAEYKRTGKYTPLDLDCRPIKNDVDGENDDFYVEVKEPTNSGKSASSKKAKTTKSTKHKAELIKKTKDESEFEFEPSSDDGDVEEKTRKKSIKKTASKIIEMKDVASSRKALKARKEVLDKAAAMVYKKGTRNYWVEYWDEGEDRWICIDSMYNKVDDPTSIEKAATEPMLYVLGMDNDFHVRDLTARYASDYLTKAFRSLRSIEKWWNETLSMKMFAADLKKSLRDSIEDLEIRRYLESWPLPKSLADYKNHPLYVLEKDLLKFEAIYPPDIKPIAEIGKHKVYPRSAVHVLQGDLNWIRMARTIRPGEKPYKVVKARPKLAIPKEKRVPLSLDVYGYWQTIPYVPPEVVDGKIPRNEHGNIYMYQPQMVPKNCLHLKLPGIFNIARKLDLEAVPAVTGWEFHGARNVPQIEGCVVLEKDAKVLREAWNEMQQRRKERDSKKVEERVWKNWKRLIKGKLLLEKMRSRFVK